jgi:hypothetical protein
LARTDEGLDLIDEAEATMTALVNGPSELILTYE